MPDGADAERVWFRLLRLQTGLELAVSARLRLIGLSVAQCDVLTTLTEQEGVSQQDLAQRLYVTKGNISSLLDRLAAAGWVERRIIPQDRRSRAIFLTSEGRRLAHEGIAAQRAFVAATLGRLPGADLSRLEALLLALRETLRTEAHDAAKSRDPAASQPET